MIIFFLIISLVIVHVFTANYSHITLRTFTLRIAFDLVWTHRTDLKVYKIGALYLFFNYL